MCCIAVRFTREIETVNVGDISAGPSRRDYRARLDAVKTPRRARPRLRRADGLDRVYAEPVLPFIDSPAVWLPLEVGKRMDTLMSAPGITVTIGQQSRLYHAFVTSAPCGLDAPATMTLYASTLADVAMFAANEVVVDASRARSCARLVLVDSTELAWQRARYREERHPMAAADTGLVGVGTLQCWLWRRLRESCIEEQARRA